MYLETPHGNVRLEAFIRSGLRIGNANLAASFPYEAHGRSAPLDTMSRRHP